MAVHLELIELNDEVNNKKRSMVNIQILPSNDIKDKLWPKREQQLYKLCNVDDNSNLEDIYSSLNEKFINEIIDIESDRNRHVPGCQACGKKENNKQQFLLIGEGDIVVKPPKQMLSKKTQASVISRPNSSLYQDIGKRVRTATVFSDDDRLNVKSRNNTQETGNSSNNRIKAHRKSIGKATGQAILYKNKHLDSFEKEKLEPCVISKPSSHNTSRGNASGVSQTVTTRNPQQVVEHLY